MNWVKSKSARFFNDKVEVYQEVWLNILPMITLYGDTMPHTIEIAWLFWGVTINFR